MTKKRIGDRGHLHQRNLSQATSSSNFYPNPLRLVWFEQRLVCKLILWLLVLATLFIALGVMFGDGRAILSVLLWIAGVVLLIPALLLMGLMVLYLRNTSEAFKNGLLTGGLVERSTQSVIHIAPLSKRTGPDGIVYGIRRVQYQAFPYGTVGKSRRIACASFFSGEVRNPPSWESFTPIPIAFGTGDKRKIHACLEAVERNLEDSISCLEILERFLYQQTVPVGFEDLYVCNSDGELLETRMIKKKRRKTPPPMPS
jgi:hypothetical protein